MELSARDLMAALPAPAVLADQDGKIALVNDAMLALTGYAREELAGRPAGTLFGNAGAAMLRRKNGGVVPGKVLSAPVNDAAGLRAGTLFVVSSKSFSTVETLMNAKTLRAWSDERGLIAEHHWFAVTGNHSAAEAFGIPKENVFDVPEWVGGRFSSWGSVGLPAALYLGWPLFEQWLNGGSAADRHFATAPLESNLPIRLALRGGHWG
jgi:predicted amidohydrolase YtcJ